MESSWGGGARPLEPLFYILLKKMLNADGGALKSYVLRPLEPFLRHTYFILFYLLKVKLL